MVAVDRVNTSDYIWMFIILCASGNPIFGYLFGEYAYLLLLVALFVFFWDKLLIGSKPILLWTLVLTTIFVAHFFTLSSITFLGSANYLTKVIIGIFAAFVFSYKFSIVYFRLISFLTTISLILWVGNVFGIKWHDIQLTDLLGSMIIYSQPTEEAYSSLLWGFHRNYGMFWEPGAFAGYILIAFFLFINRLDYLWSEYRKSTIILIAGLASTFSTTGYIVFCVILFTFFYIAIRKKKIYALAGLLTVFLLSYLFNSLEFMGEKIYNEYDYAMQMEETDFVSSRIGAIVMDWQYIKLHPIIGNGLLNETRFSRHMDIISGGSIGVGNGFSGEIAYLGIPFMLLYLYLIYRNRTLKKKWVLIICLTLVLQGEYFMNYPFFFVFPYVCFFQQLKGNVLSKKVIHAKR